jgi:outer membrane protein OmpA-like peptidoglycan-associated protein
LAQDYVSFAGLSIGPGYKNSYERNRVFDNTFLSFSFGSNIYFGDYNGDIPFEDRLCSMNSISFGKWYNPYIGNRLKYDVGRFKNYIPNSGYISPIQLAYGNVHLDFLFDITNCFGQYDEYRVIRVIPFIGGGYAHRREKMLEERNIKRSESPTINMGLMFPIRLNNRVDFIIEGQYTMLNEQFNRVDVYHEEDRIVNITVGINFKLGKTYFQTIEPMDYSKIDDLNDEINHLRGQNNKLKRRVYNQQKHIDNTIIVDTVKKEILHKVVIFRLNSSIINSNQMVNIFDVAEYALEHNLPIHIKGYADRETGNSDYNYWLSERRAKAVAKILNEKYNIPRNKMVISYFGDEMQPYYVNEWNRLVILTCE